MLHPRSCSIRIAAGRPPTAPDRPGKSGPTRIPAALALPRCGLKSQSNRVAGSIRHKLAQWVEAQRLWHRRLAGSAAAGTSVPRRKLTERLSDEDDGVNVGAGRVGERACRSCGGAEVGGGLHLQQHSTSSTQGQACSSLGQPLILAAHSLHPSRPAFTGSRLRKQPSRSACQSQ